MPSRSAFGQHTLPREYFASREIFELEQERIFGGCWILAGHVSDLPETGSYFLHELGSESVLVLRDRADEVRAFHNLCRHRGSRLCLEARGEVGPRIQCPYHAWTYALDGALLGAPNMRDVPGFDPAEHRLHPVAVEVWRGFVFVNLGRHPAALEESMPGLFGRFEAWPLEELRSVHRTVYEIDANWKLFFHNYSECYHCPTVHPHLNRLTPYRNTDNDLVDGPVLGGPMWMSRSDGSMTMDGGRCAEPFPGLSEAERGRVYYYTLFPSAFLSLHPDYVLVHRARPLAIDRTRIVCDWLFHPSAAGVPGFDPTPAVEFWDLTNRQDWELCANAHRGVVSRAWVPGPYADLESQLAAFDRYYLRALDPGAGASRLADRG